MLRPYHIPLAVASLLLASVLAVSAQSQPSGPTNIPGCVYLSSPGTLTNNQTAPCTMTSDRKIRVDATASIAFPTIGDPVPLTGVYMAAEGSTGDLEGLLLDASRNLNVNCVVGCAGGTFNNNADNVATSADNGKSAAWNYVWDGSAWDRLYGNSAGGLFAQGAAADNAASAGNPVSIGGTYNTTQPTYDNGDRATAQFGARGSLRVQLAGADSTANITATVTNSDDVAATAVGLVNMAFGYVYDGTAWDRLRGDATNGALVNLGSNNDVTVTSGLIAAQASASATGSTRCSIVIANTENETNCKNGAGNVYGFTAYNNTATIMYLTLYNAHSGAVCGTSEIETHLIPASTSGAGVVVSFATPVAFSTGISYCVTTGIDGTGAPAANTGAVNLYYQ